MSLVFIPETHTYLYNGREVPSVTTILKAVGLQKFFHDEVAMALGTQVHKLIKDYEKGDLDGESVHPVFKGYLQAYKKFKSDMEYQTIISETPLHSPLGFCGTPDSFGFSDIKNHASYLLPDFKTGGMDWTTGLQLAGYERLIRDNNLIKYALPVKRMGVHLGADGDWSGKVFTDRSDWSIFLNSVSICNAIINNGGKLNE